MEVQDNSEVVEQGSETVDQPETTQETIENEAQPEQRHPLGSEDPVTKNYLKKVAESAKKAPETTKTGQKDVANPLGDSQLGENAAGKPEPEMPKYEPNFKFKVLDKEHEIPEYLRGAIKDAETEKKVRELHEKAFGLDIIKPKFQQTRQELQALTSDIQELRTHYQRGDLDTFFQKLNIPQEKVFQYVLDKINYDQMSPEQKALVDSRRAAEQKAFQLEKQSAEIEGRYYEQATQAKRMMLESVLARPDVQTAAQAFEARTGKPGSFLQTVASHGEMAWYRSNGKVDLTPEQAVQEVMQMYGLVGMNPQAATGQQPVATQPVVVPTAKIAAQTPAAQKAPAKQPAAPTLPRIEARASSPTKQKPKSIADLKKLAEQME